MPFPSEVITRFVTHQYLDPDSGAPCSGTVELQPTSVMMYPGGTIVKSSIIGNINPATGMISLEAPVNDAPNISPQGTSYKLIESTINPINPGGPAHWLRISSVQILTGAGPIDIGSLIPAPADLALAPIVRGPKGDPGLPGETYVFNQATPAATWSIPHALTIFAPKVLILLSGEASPVITDTQYSSGQVVLEFPSAVAGTAYLS
jgi:hypothetical protein